MAEKQQKWAVRSKVWIEDDAGNVVFGMGRVKILHAIQRHGSLKKAAEALSMSYRGLWGRVHATEIRLGIDLLTRQIGGKAGGGSCLTPDAENLIRDFTALHEDVVKETDRLFTQRICDDLHKTFGKRNTEQTPSKQKRNDSSED